MAIIIPQKKSWKDVVKITANIQNSQYTIINSTDKPISFECDGDEQNVITLLPEEMITDINSFKPVILDMDEEEQKKFTWVTDNHQRYRVKEQCSLTSTWRAAHLDPQIMIDVVDVEYMI